MSQPGKLASFLLSVVSNNFWLKLISLVTALGFYAFIHSAKPLSQKFEVRVAYEEPETSTRKGLSSDIPKTVLIDVVGPAQAVQQIDEDDLYIRLNLSGGQDDDLTLTKDMISELPPRVKVKKFSPPLLEIRFEDVIDRAIKVQVTRTGEPASDMEVSGNITVQPEVVTATGIKSLVDTIQFARTEAFDVTGLGQGVTTRMLKLDPAPQGVDYDQASITARVDIKRKLATKQFLQIPVEVVGLPRAKTKPRQVSIQVTGSEDVVSKIVKEMIVPQVDPSKAEVDLGQPGSANFSVVVDIPDVQIEVRPTKFLVKW